MDREKLAPCGVFCGNECPYFEKSCAGCAEIEGKAFWLKYTGGDKCKIYRCCTEEKEFPHCGKCGSLPCSHYNLKDPSMSEEEIEKSLQARLKRLRSAK